MLVSIFCGFIIGDYFDNLFGWIFAIIVTIYLSAKSFDWFGNNTISNEEKYRRIQTRKKYNQNIQEQEIEEQRIDEKCEERRRTEEALKQKLSKQKSDNDAAQKISQIIKVQNAFKKLIRDDFTTSPCNSCNDSHYRYLLTNSIGSGVRVQCVTCSRKKWVHIVIEKNNYLVLEVLKK